MKFEKIHNKGQARIFQSQYLEMLTKCHPLVIWGFYTPIIAYFFISWLYTNFDFTVGYMVMIFLAGMFFWTFFEYIMHRFVFHYIAHSRRAQRIVYVMHGNHHEYPRDKERLFMPPVPSLILASIIFSLLYLLMEPMYLCFSRVLFLVI